MINQKINNKKLNPSQILVLGFLTVIMIGAILLTLPHIATVPKSVLIVVADMGDG
jgi:hypothetical protein